MAVGALAAEAAKARRPARVEHDRAHNRVAIRTEPWAAHSEVEAKRRQTEAGFPDWAAYSRMEAKQPQMAAAIPQWMAFLRVEIGP